ncbi:MAG: hypothetical protein IM638_02850 [Bacteroidetes bacterium]|nr:hypothetical protein [Bacteroidota bacterium]
MKITKIITVLSAVALLLTAAPFSVAYYTENAPTKVVVQHPEKYSLFFLNELANSGCAKTVTLIDSLFIIDGNDTAFLPTGVSRQNERFTGKTEQYAIQLIIKRNTFSSVNFNLTCREESGKQTTFRGEAHLRPCFFMGAEMDEDENGNMYPADEFVYTTPGNLETISFRIGNSEGMAVKTTIESPDVKIGLDGSPVLRLAK